MYVFALHNTYITIISHKLHPRVKEKYSISNNMILYTTYHNIPKPVLK